MRLTIFRSISLIILVAVAMLIGSPPASAAPMPGVMDNCHTNTCQESNVIPQCCIISDCSPSNNFSISVALPHHRLTLNDSIYVNRFQENLTPGHYFNQSLAFKRDNTHVFPVPLFNEYHCRSSLSTDELPQI